MDKKMILANRLSKEVAQYKSVLLESACVCFGGDGDNSASGSTDERKMKFSKFMGSARGSTDGGRKSSKFMGSGWFLDCASPLDTVFGARSRLAAVLVVDLRDHAGFIFTLKRKN
jgi:hypothetical protein